jgi:hypothetical protein
VSTSAVSRDSSSPRVRRVTSDSPIQPMMTVSSPAPAMAHEVSESQDRQPASALDREDWEDMKRPLTVPGMGCSQSRFYAANRPTSQ